MWFLGVAFRGHTRRLVGDWCRAAEASRYFGPHIFQNPKRRPNDSKPSATPVNFLMTVPVEARADRCGCRSLLMASAAGLSVACIAMVSVCIAHTHSDVDACGGRRTRSKVTSSPPWCSSSFWSGHSVHRDHSEKWFHPGVMSRCVMSGRDLESKIDVVRAFGNFAFAEPWCR